MQAPSAGGGAVTGVSEVATIEGQIAAKLTEAADNVSHTESLDAEERAEIYTILQTLRADTEFHCEVVGRWVSDRKRERGDA